MLECPHTFAPEKDVSESIKPAAEMSVEELVNFLFTVQY